ncbi:MAG: hypothetical protein AAF772_03775 [Acidobacteriota bacterium]
MTGPQRIEPPAPVFTQSYDLYAWLLDRLADAPSARTAPALEHAQHLLDAVTLALRGSAIDRRLDEAQQAIVLLGVHLRVLNDAEVLCDRQALHAHGLLRSIGRQVGGWQRQRRRRA